MRTCPTFLLVHGGYHRSTCWTPLREELAARGWPSQTVDMPSAGEQRVPSAGLYDDAEELTACLRGMEGPVVVVAHSHSGLTVSQLPLGLDQVAHLVFIAAFMPDTGESAATCFGVPVPDDVSGLAPPIENPRSRLYADVSEEEAALAVSRLVDQSLRSCTETTTRAAWRELPSTYVVCEQDQNFPVPLQERFAAQATHTERLPTGHSPFLSQPRALADLLIRAALGRS
ncbi:alpha/beta hydrolase [Streptomyces fuscigenes]|uniref:alpha/beta hydrolase n=1 Tax=Streptomyces fuscigenes TaxID=1528880 RepID=UPI001F4815F5|nr:alpha/beta hydrolase [Streptomyces fuscigenes]MCF3961225.1 alpha/beta hydrolase [Streptomyces fuscigenes]